VKQVNLVPIDQEKNSRGQSSSTKVKRREVKSLMNEIEMLKSLSHQNIVRYLGTEKSKKHLFVFMEFCAGHSVAHAIKKWGALCEAVVRRYTVQILCGLCYLHSKFIGERRPVQASSKEAPSPRESATTITRHHPYPSPLNSS
jgi:serine/threonine protein kinase